MFTVVSSPWSVLRDLSTSVKRFPPGVVEVSFTVSLSRCVLTNSFMSLSAFCVEAATPSSDPATTGPSPFAVPKTLSENESSVQPDTKNRQTHAAPTSPCDLIMLNLHSEPKEMEPDDSPSGAREGGRGRGAGRPQERRGGGAGAGQRGGAGARGAQRRAAPLPTPRRSLSPPCACYLAVA